MHCAVLATNVGGNPEIIENEKSGLLVPNRDSKAIINGLYRLKDASCRHTYSEEAYKRARELFSIENTYGKLEKIFSE